MSACLTRYDSPLNCRSLPWCTTLSMAAAAIWSSPNTDPHLENPGFGSHMERSSELVHDREKPHRVLAERLDLESGACDAKRCCMLPDKDSPLNMASQECSLLKKFLRSHSGFRAADIQGWLDLWWVSRNVGDTMDEKAAWVLDRAMRCRKVPRYKDFYAKKTS